MRESAPQYKAGQIAKLQGSRQTKAEQDRRGQRPIRERQENGARRDGRGGSCEDCWHSQPQAEKKAGSASYGKCPKQCVFQPLDSRGCKRPRADKLRGALSVCDSDDQILASMCNQPGLLSPAVMKKKDGGEETVHAVAMQRMWRSKAPSDPFDAHAGPMRRKALPPSALGRGGALKGTAFVPICWTCLHRCREGLTQ